MELDGVCVLPFSLEILANGECSSNFEWAEGYETRYVISFIDLGKLNEP